MGALEAVKKEKRKPLRLHRKEIIFVRRGHREEGGTRLWDKLKARGEKREGVESCREKHYKRYDF